MRYSRLLLVLALVPVLLAFGAAVNAQPFFAGLPGWAAPALVGWGVLLGLLTLVVSPRSNWFGPMIGLSGGAALAGGYGLARLALGTLPPAGTAAAVNVPGTAAMGVLIPVSSAFVVWFATHQYLARLGFLQAVLSLALPWLFIAASFASWSRTATPPPAFWVLMAGCSSFLVMLVTHLRVNVIYWTANHLREVNGPGTVMSAMRRDGMVLFLVATVIMLIPIGAQAAWGNLLPQHPVDALRGLFTQQNASGSAITQIGAPVAVRQPAPSANVIIAHYAVLAGQEGTPLLAATYDQYGQDTWREGPTTNTQGATFPFRFPSGVELMRARITINAFPQGSQIVWLPAFDEPFGIIGLTAQAVTIPNTTRDLTGLAGWRVAAALSAGTSYEVDAARVSLDAASGQLSPALQTRMTALPAEEAAAIQPYARQWAGDALTRADIVSHLTTRINHDFVYDPQAMPPDGTDAVAWWLTQKRTTILGAATLEVIALRDLGIPARLAQGFSAQGGVIYASNETYWVQVAVAGAGWYDASPFAPVRRVQPPPKTRPQPTSTPIANGGGNGKSGSQPTPTGDKMPPKPQPTPQPATPPFMPPLPTAAFPLCLIGLLALTLFLGLIIWLAQPRKATVRVVMRWYGRYVRYVAGNTLPRSDTPREALARSLSIAPLAWRPIIQAWNDLYIGEVYGARSAPVIPARQTRRFSIVMFLAALTRRLMFWRKG